MLLQAEQDFKAWLEKYGRSQCDAIMRAHLRKRLEGAENRPPRIKVSLTERRNMFVRQSGICPICGKLMHGGALRQLDVDHIDPTAVDFNGKKNLKLTHSGCNRSKGAGSLSDVAKKGGRTVIQMLRDATGQQHDEAIEDGGMWPKEAPEPSDEPDPPTDRECEAAAREYEARIHRS